MSFHFSEKSLKNLETCHPDLIRIANELIKEMDVAIICGHRDKAAQNNAFIRGRSSYQWPRSKHNKMPSEAMDIVPMPLDWKNIPAFLDMCKRIERIADELKIKIRLGRDFAFKDINHIELHDKNRK